MSTGDRRWEFYPALLGGNSCGLGGDFESDYSDRQDDSGHRVLANNGVILISLLRQKRRQTKKWRKNTM